MRAIKLLFFSLLFCGCFSIPEDITPPAWDSEWLLPLAFGDFVLEDLEPFARFDFDAFASAEDLGLALRDHAGHERRSSLGPYPVEWDAPVQYAETGLVRLDVKLINGLPATFTTTCTLRVVDPVTSTLGFTLPVALNVPANGTFSTELILMDVAISSGIELYIDDLNGVLEPGGVPEPGSGMRIEVEASLEDITRIDLAADETFHLEDTVPVSLELPSEDLELAEEANGTLQLTLENGLPLGAGIQLVFLDAFGVELDRLESTEEALLVPELAPDGTVLAPVEQTLLFALSLDRLESLEAAEEITYRFNAFTPSTPDPLSLRADDGISIRSTLQLQLLLEP